jgi:hypothetical protein
MCESYCFQDYREINDTTDGAVMGQFHVPTRGISTEEVDESGSVICGEFMFDEASVEMKGN